MIYNYTKCESVIAKILADLDSSEVKNRITDIKEWIFEAVEKIGAPVQYIARESGADGFPILKIEDNQVPLPPDLVTLDGVAFSNDEKGPWVPMVKATAIFKEPRRKNRHEHRDPHFEDRKMFTAQSQFYTINGMKYAVDNILKNKYDEPKYFIKPGWVVVNKPKGYIKLAYKAIATDDRGYPLIPDLPSYQEAVYWYVVMKLTFPKYMQGALSGRSNKYAAKYAAQSYQYVESKWNFHRNQAYAEAMMPTAGDLENIKNDWNKLVPDFEGEDRFFDNITDDQQFYSDYYYGY